MDKEEVLEKSRKEYGIADEREKQGEYRASYFGMWITFAIMIAYSQVKSAVFGQETGDIMAMAFLGVSVTFFARYRHSRYRGYLAGGIVFVIGAAIFFGTYILRLNGIDV